MKKDENNYNKQAVKFCKKFAKSNRLYRAVANYWVN
ncbi:hypothetical protein L280_10380 [Mannheimia haemolytica MhBrain2012]|nr:hypothetical protein F382_13200 [Mannheimia haemolytica D153]AGQ39768.1 hypothetical protein J450_11815 [Mannheimia haemolytica D171]AGQ42424.1 hypothetical protein J451_13435 [Mannheimia haemolytica D174]AGR74816.1 hypothetical protein N220_05390 [Mannheimia haemolytica USMARC_2286]EPY98876.1 hypothetical protein L278_02590 [Mannheimia haemolytica D35]EPZ02360.1 hypothetical protein L279_01780 [Mannheimia haemolytica D38]EPZ23575.1 hypothetical protein L277_04135 [Mannheimia haemolytica D